jgi:hypothetical protein
MDERLLNWLKDHKGQTFGSPREIAFGKKTYPIKINDINEDLQKVAIELVGGTPGLPLFFWMFDRAIALLEANKGQVVRIGAKVSPP